MSTPVPASTLDELLALQLTVAWAGEGRCEPPRLGWWQTDLVDSAGGGDLLERLLPRVMRPITEALFDTTADAMVPPLADLRERFAARLARAWWRRSWSCGSCRKMELRAGAVADEGG